MIMKEREPTPKQLRVWQDEIVRNGTKRITARALLKTFGIQRRGPHAIERVTQWLLRQHPPIYISGLDRVQLLDEPTFLSCIEMTQIGRLVERESVLMDRFEGDIMPLLGLRNPQRGFRPLGSRDQLDYLCEDASGCSVVVEMKKEDGERHVVEQTLRYIRLLRQTPSCKNPRGLILTGYADLHTRRALEELEPRYHIDWFVYGLDDNAMIRVQQIKMGSVGSKT